MHTKAEFVFGDKIRKGYWKVYVRSSAKHPWFFTGAFLETEEQARRARAGLRLIASADAPIPYTLQSHWRRLTQEYAGSPKLHGRKNK